MEKNEGSDFRRLVKDAFVFRSRTVIVWQIGEVITTVIEGGIVS